MKQRKCLKRKLELHESQAFEVEVRSRKLRGLHPTWMCLGGDATLLW